MRVRLNVTLTLTRTSVSQVGKGASALLSSHISMSSQCYPGPHLPPTLHVYLYPGGTAAELAACTSSGPSPHHGAAPVSPPVKERDNVILLFRCINNIVHTTA